MEDEVRLDGRWMEVTTIVILQASGERVTLKNDGEHSQKEREGGGRREEGENIIQTMHNGGGTRTRMISTRESSKSKN